MAWFQKKDRKPLRSSERRDLPPDVFQKCKSCGEILYREKLAQNLEVIRGAEEAGADLVLLSYPPNFYPESEQEIYDYTKAFCDATDLGVILFPMTHWGFERLHSASIPVIQEGCGSGRTGGTGDGPM